MTVDQIAQFIDKVKTGGDWDYKNNKIFNQALGSGIISRSLLDEFGNFHFGAVANAYGFRLPTTLVGAGGYQVFFQEGGSFGDFFTGGMTAAKAIYNIRAITNNGFTWGDNPGDSIAIMQGWDYAENY